MAKLPGNNKINLAIFISGRGSNLKTLLKNSFNYKLKLGASLVQIYTGFIFHGPKLIKEILR